VFRKYKTSVEILAEGRVYTKDSGSGGENPRISPHPRFHEFSEPSVLINRQLCRYFKTVNIFIFKLVTFFIELKCSLSFVFIALKYFKHAEVIITSLYSTVVLWSDFGRIFQQILGFQIDHEFRLTVDLEYW
jgi:hypothetical protein